MNEESHELRGRTMGGGDVDAVRRIERARREVRPSIPLAASRFSSRFSSFNSRDAWAIDHCPVQRTRATAAESELCRAQTKQQQ
jgi:hypothetical protein